MHRKTVSIESPNTFPTIGINVLLAPFSPFNVSPSTPLVKVPSKEIIVTNKLKAKPIIHTILDFNILESLLICILSERFDTIPSTVDISKSGNMYNVIPFPKNTITPRIIGCNVLPVIGVPDVTTNAKSNGIKRFGTETGR